MRNIMKKLIIAGAAAALTLGMLTACTKMTEKRDDGEQAKEELSQSAGAEDMREEEDAGMENGASGDGGAAAAGEEAQLNGVIEKIPPDSDDHFMITKLAAGQGDGGDTKLTVVYSADTVFVKWTVRDDGDNVEETEGSAADLREGFTVEMKGSYYDETVFFATDVKIVEEAS